MTVYDFKNVVKRLYPRASAGEPGALLRYIRLIKRRKKNRRCQCGCGQILSDKHGKFALNACRARAGNFGHRRRLMIAAVVLALCTLLAPAKPAWRYRVWLTWWPPTTNTHLVRGYEVFWGTVTNEFTASTNVGANISANITIPWQPVTYFAVAAYDSNHVHGDLSAPFVVRLLGSPSIVGFTNIQLQLGP